jgi:mono/diheme cytochrome c family protein
MKFCTFVLFVAVSFLIGGCGKSVTETPSRTAPSAPAATATPDEFASARGIYAKHCLGCHGQEGKGGPVKTPEGERLKVPSLTEGHALRHVDQDFVEQIENGGDGMPKFKDKLTPAEIHLMVRFVRHEFQGK